MNSSDAGAAQSAQTLASLTPVQRPIPTERALLAEYESAHNEVDRLNRQLWSMGQILIPLSLTAFGLLISKPLNHKLQDLLVTIVAALASTLILWGWLDIAKRWLAYQSIAQYRMVEIERQLGLWCLRYELYAANPIGEMHPILGTGLTQAERAELERIPSSLRPTGNSTKVVIRNLVLTLVALWMLLVLTKSVLLLQGIG